MIAVTALYAGILALMLAALSLFVVQGRFKNKVSIGDGGNQDMLARMRAHSNFIEYVPMALLAIYLLEVTGHGAWLLHALGIVLVAARAAHPFGMMRKSPNPYRAAGSLLTLGVLIVAGVLLILTFLRGL